MSETDSTSKQRQVTLEEYNSKYEVWQRAISTPVSEDQQLPLGTKPEFTGPRISSLDAKILVYAEPDSSPAEIEHRRTEERETAARSSIHYFERTDQQNALDQLRAAGPPTPMVLNTTS